jgi:hypothetical protein
MDAASNARHRLNDQSLSNRRSNETSNISAHPLIEIEVANLSDAKISMAGSRTNILGFQ